MFSIGEFSAICRMSIKALRHYDQIGLLKPVYVDPDSGYRFYSESQLEKALIINRLKMYGFSLAKIRDILEQSGNHSCQLQALKDQFEKLNEEIACKNAIRLDMKQYIADFERTGKLMNTSNSSIQVVAVPELTVYSVRKTISMDEMGRMYSLLFETAGKEGITPAGPTGAAYLSKEFNRDECDTAVFFLCDPENASAVLPETKAVKLTHKGGYSTLGESYAAIVRYIQDHGLEIAGPPYELYLKNQMQNIPVSEWETEIYFPVK